MARRTASGSPSNRLVSTITSAAAMSSGMSRRHPSTRNLSPEPAVLRDAHGRAAERPVSGDPEAGASQAPPRIDRRASEGDRVLLRLQVPDLEEEEVAPCEAEPAPERRAIAALPVRPPVDPVVEHPQIPRTTDPSLPPGGLRRRAAGQEHEPRTGRQALEQGPRVAHRLRLGAVERPPVHVMEDSRRRVREDRRQAADEAGLAAVGVERIEPFRAQSASEPEQAAEVAQRPHGMGPLAPHTHGQAGDPARLLEQLPARRREQVHLVPALDERTALLEAGLLGAAQVEPGDELEDLHDPAGEAAVSRSFAATSRPSRSARSMYE